MSRDEIHGFRDETYSRWHRSIPLDLDFIDVDWQELCSTCHKRVMVYELKRDVGQTVPPANVSATRRLGQDLRVPAFLVLYRVEAKRITQFRVRELWPRERDERFYTPEEWTQVLVRARCHEVQESRETVRRPSYALQPTAPSALVPNLPKPHDLRFCHSCRSLHPVGVSCGWPESA